MINEQYNEILTPSEDYLHALDEYLVGIKDTPYYEGVRSSHLNDCRFLYWIGLLQKYKNLNDIYIADIGCGSGGMLLALSCFSIRRGIGIEIDSALKHLSECKLKNFDKIEIIQTDGKSLPFEDNYFDIVTSIHVIEHVTDICTYLNQLYRVLKPNGLALIECPNRLYPVEPHTSTKLIHFLPKKFIAFILSMNKIFQFISDDNYLKLKGILDLNFISHFKMEALISNYDIQIFEFDPVDRFTAENQRFELLAKILAINKINVYLAKIFSKNILMIFKKNK